MFSKSKYECPKCHLECRNSYILDKHLSKKKSCVVSENISKNDLPNYKFLEKEKEKLNMKSIKGLDKLKIIDPIEITETIYVYRPKKVDDYLEELMNDDSIEDQIIDNKSMKIDMSKMLSQEKYLDLIYGKLYEIGENIFKNVLNNHNEKVFSERVLILPNDTFPLKKEKFKEFVGEYVVNLLAKLFKNESICEDTVKINVNIKEITVLI